MTENVRRYRGNRILQALLDEIRLDTRWKRATLEPAGLPTRTPGRYDPTAGKYDTTAGPRGGHRGPEYTLITIQELPPIDYPGEEITATPRLYFQLFTDLSRARVLTSVREWARMEKPSPIASYWPSRGFVAFTHYPPGDLRPDLQKAVQIVGEATPTNFPSHAVNPRNLQPK